MHWANSIHLFPDAWWPWLYLTSLAMIGIGLWMHVPDDFMMPKDDEDDNA